MSGWLDPDIKLHTDTASQTVGFGTKEQPNKPARTTVQVVLPAGERGGLVEIDSIAVRPR